MLATAGGIGALGVGGYAFTTVSRAGTDERHVRLENVDSIPDVHQLRINIELLESQITDSQTARLAITTTNQGPKREISIGNESWCVILNRHHCRSDPRGVFLYRSDRAKSLKRDGKRWIPHPSDQWMAFNDGVCPAKTYDSEESVRTEYEVWDDHKYDGYLQPGTYRWQRRIPLYPSDIPASEAPVVTWGFSLSMEK
jgi:hypothetical protein